MTRLRPLPPIAGLAGPLSPLVLGTAFFTCADRQPWFDLLDAYVEAGGTVIDSGRVYGDSEEVIGYSGWPPGACGART